MMFLLAFIPTTEAKRFLWYSTRRKMGYLLKRIFAFCATAQSVGLRRKANRWATAQVSALRRMGVLTDITTRKNAELDAQRHRDELAHVSRVSMMGQLASALAHELNQPLGAILRNAEAAELFLQASPPDLQEVRVILADIRKDDQRAGEVIDRMRAFLKRRESHWSELDLNAVTEEVVGLLRFDAEARRVKLTLELSRSVPGVRGDRVQLQQVLLNLILNAMDAMNGCEAGRRCVAVCVRPREEEVEVAVSDSGHGILTDNVKRLFEPFFTTKTSGMGMGLAISRTIIEVHGGRLWAENNPEGGATFRFTLPIVARDVSRDAARVSRHSLPETRHLNTGTCPLVTCHLPLFILSMMTLPFSPPSRGCCARQAST